MKLWVLFAILIILYQFNLTYERNVKNAIKTKNKEKLKEIKARLTNKIKQTKESMKIWIRYGKRGSKQIGLDDDHLDYLGLLKPKNNNFS